MRDDSRSSERGAEQVSPAMLDQFLAVELALDDERRVLAWAGSRHAVSLAAEVRAAIQAPAHKGDRAYTEPAIMLDLLSRRLGISATPEVRERSRGPRMLHVAAPLGWSRMATAGAVALGIMMVAVIGIQRSAQSTLRAQPHTYRTASAQKAVVTLPDGSRVTLAPYTTLTVGAGFGATQRTVRVGGEAFFEVRSGSKTPFVVHAGHVRAQVLGTAFDVRHYPEQRDVRIAVVRGRVAVSTANDSAMRRSNAVVLTANMVGVTLDSTTVVTSTPDALLSGDWTRGKLVFRAAAVPDVLRELGRWYGYEFRIADSSLAQQQLTVTIQGQSADGVMAMLRTMLNASMTVGGKDHRVVTLHAKRADVPSGMPGRESLRIHPREVGR
jgi:ferric-dicitrate binding protein FerR (iron transport regulator)